MAGINLLGQLRGKKKNKKNTNVSSVSSVSGISQVSIRQTASNFLMGQGGDDRRVIVRFIAMIAFLVLGYKGLEIYLQGELEVQQVELEKIQQNLAKENKRKNELKSVQEEMLGYQTRMKDIDSKIKLVSSRESMRDYFVRALDYLATEMPRDVWFSEIIATRGGTAEKDNTLSIKGFANSPQAVSELILKLDNSVYFPKSTLERMESTVPGEITKTPGSIPIPVNARKFYILSKLGE